MDRLVRYAVVAGGMTLPCLPVFSEAADQPHVKVVSVAPAQGATVVTYLLANPSPQSYALVRVNCDTRDGSGTPMDEASDVTMNLGARQSVTGQAYFDTAAVTAAKTVSCRIERAYR
jgi:hypothetical protein